MDKSVEVSRAGARLRLPALRRFGQHRGGGFAILFAFTLVPIILAAGMALDYGFAANSRSKLQNALDSAVLAATSTLTAASDDDEIRQYVETMVAANLNLPAEDVRVSVTIDQSVRAVVVNGFVDQRTYLLPIVGIDRVPVAAKTKAVLGRPFIELALVLDNSGSMEGERIKRLRSASRDLARTVLDIGYESGDTRVALVPFAGMVNVGPANAAKAWMDRAAQSPIHAENFDTPANRFDLYASMQDVSWAGCVEARPSPHDVTDSAPSAANASTLFVPSFAPDEPDRPTIYPYNNYLNDSPASCAALDSGASDKTRQERVCKYAGATPDQSANLGTHKGPNLLCDSRPITPLTANFATLNTAIGQMEALGGTNIHEGLMWGWRVLSPGEPFTEGKAYSDGRNSKIIVLMTDGTNQFIGRTTGINKSVYSAYGYAKAGRLGITSDNTNTLKEAMDARTRQACTNVKAAGIELYTVAWHVTEQATIDMLSECATRPDMAAVAETDADLETVFKRIGREIGKLRLVN